jgi:hypothetical protein
MHALGIDGSTDILEFIKAAVIMNHSMQACGSGFIEYYLA